MTDVASDPRWKLFDKPFEFVAGGKTHQGEKTVDIISPRDKRVVGSYWVPSLAQVDEALAAARKAYEEVWSKTNGNARADYLRKIAVAFDQHKEELEFLDAVDIGKTVNGFRYSDVGVSLEALNYYAGRAMNIAGSSVDVGDPDVWHRSRFEPYGVVLEVLPWNGPIWTGLQNVAAILAAGNVAVVKPAGIASASFLHFAKIMNEILPAGVLTVLPGPGGSIGNALVTHPQVDFISLTGGVETGRQVLKDSADRIRRVSLELGGKNPNIVLDDADLDTAVMWSTMGGFSNTGQICVCGSRILVQRGIYEEFTEKLVASAKELVIGDPLLDSTTTGPVVGESHYESVWRYIDDAKATNQGRLILGGERYEGDLANGFYIPPTIFADVDETCVIAREEIFGPVVSLTPFDDIDDALRIANDTTMGLASGVFTKDINRASYVADRLQAGQVYVNQWFAPGGTRAPSEGYKQSGIGGVGLYKYMQEKNIFFRTN